MGAFLYAISLQWKLDIRSKTILITCYIVPLLFFAIMGEIFTSVMPESKYTLIQSMTVFGVTMGSFIGLPPSLVEIYSSDINKVYKANGVPLYLGLVLTNISAYIHLFIMSILLYITAPFFFHAEIPEHPGLTQDQLIAKMQIKGSNMSRSTLANIEAGRRNIKVYDLKLIKEILDVPYECFFES